MKLAYTYGVRDSQGNLDVTKNNGNVESQTITVPTAGNSQGFTATQYYEYDELNRLTQAKETSNSSVWWQQQFSYDRYGNRTVITGQNATTESIVGPNPEIETSTNRIKPKANSTEQYQFDASGNMTRDAEGNRFTFDAENHQTKYFISTNNTTDADALYFYDGDGKRVKKVVGNEVTIFVYGGGGALVAEYTQNITAPTNPQTVYLTKDALGTPRINTNQKGEVVARHDYLPFGDEINIVLGQQTMGSRYGHSEYVPDDVRQKFTGYEKDKETGLDFAQARYYGEGLGRFTSVDPALESMIPILPQSWNRYSYTLNNPVRFTDPSGMVCCSGLATTFIPPASDLLNDGPQEEETSFWNRKPPSHVIFDGIARAGHYYLIDGLWMTSDEIFWNSLTARVQIIANFYQQQEDGTLRPYDVSGLTDVQAIYTRNALFEKAKNGEIKKVDADNLQKGSPVNIPTDLIPGIGPTKSVGLPSSKKVRVDMEHIKDRHMEGGKTLAQSNSMGGQKTVFPSNMTAKQVERAVREAYKNGKRIETQGERVVVRGQSGQLTIEMYVNTATRVIETAYPIF